MCAHVTSFRDGCAHITNGRDMCATVTHVVNVASHRCAPVLLEKEKRPVLPEIPRYFQDSFPRGSVFPQMPRLRLPFPLQAAAFAFLSIAVVHGTFFGEMQTQIAPCRRMVCLSLSQRTVKHLHPYKLVQEQVHAQRLRGRRRKRTSEGETEPERKRPALQSERANETCILQEIIGPCEVVVPQSS